MRPVVHGLEDKYAAKVDFVYLDVDDPTSDAAKRKLGYRVQPDLYLIDAQGNIVQRWIGLVEAKSLEEALSKIK
jgi:hypothetical protein